MKLDFRTLGNPAFLRRALLATTAAVFALTTANTFAEVINARYASAADVPVSADGFIASGKSVDLTLNIAPVEGQDLMLVKNTGPNFILGEFNNLAQGQIVALQYNGVSYHFVANYYGGNGRDLVLMPISLDDLSVTALAKIDDPLLLSLKRARGQAPFDRAISLRPETVEKAGRVLVNIKGSISNELANQIVRLGGDVIGGWQTATTLRAWVPPTQLEAVANLAGIQSISAARLSITRPMGH